LILPMETESMSQNSDDKLRVTRRGMVLASVAAGVFGKTGRTFGQEHQPAARPLSSDADPQMLEVNLTVNGMRRPLKLDTRTTILDALREHLGLTGTKKGCDHGQCGACTVLVNGAARRSCVTPVGSIGDNEVTTLEGLGTLDKPHPLQKAFIDEQAAQCGYCASGMIMAAADLLNRNPQPQEADVRASLADNLCRCGTHNRIIRAVLRAAKGTA
jgi:nicotinate dehydrogenase subunit A